MAGNRRILMCWAGGLEHAGGIGRMAGNLLRARSLAGRAEIVHCIDTRGPGTMLLAPAYLGWALVRIAFAGLCRGPVIAHVHMADSGSTVRKVILCRALRLVGIRYLLHLHPGNYDTYYRALPRWAKRTVGQTFADASLVVVLGERWRRLVADDIRAPAGRIRVVPNGVPDPGMLAEPSVDREPLIVLLGELQPWKGVSELIAALGTLLDRHWHLVCAGRGDPAQYQAEAAAAGIADRVSFPGWMDRGRSAELLRAAAIMAVPSHIEGFSVALIEAMALGVPIVATPVGAHPDVLRDHENALLVPPKDVPALAIALMELLDHPSLRERIGRAGRVTFEARLDIRLIESRFADAYTEMLALPRPGRFQRAGLTAMTGHESIR